ncbi:MAG: hypothetical protein R2909_07070 [Gemmatimonadales bacterium]
MLEQRHQRFDLFGGPLPVLLTEGEDGEGSDVGQQAGLHDPPHRRHAGLVPLRPGQLAALRPAAVAVHDDGDVPRPEGGVLLDFGELQVGGARHTSIISASLSLIRSSISLV